ncbi:MAG: rhodanese-like domain-containing protein [Pseudomonadota bacterium]
MPPLSQFAEFATNHPILASALFGSLLLLVVSEITRKARALVDLSSTDVVRLMNGNGQVIDTRSEDAFAKGHLAGARHIPAADVSADNEKFKRLTDKPVIIVCDNGMASSKLAGTLRKQGLADIFSLQGGLEAWQRDNLPLVAERKEKKNKSKKKNR